jgi:hypothetical protein
MEARNKFSLLRKVLEVLSLSSKGMEDITGFLLVKELHLGQEGKSLGVQMVIIVPVAHFQNISCKDNACKYVMPQRLGSCPGRFHVHPAS